VKLCLSLKKEHKLQAFKNKMLRIYGLRNDEVMGIQGNSITYSSIICSLHQHHQDNPIKEDETGIMMPAVFLYHFQFGT
jgi:hypothetical protein